MLTIMCGIPGSGKSYYIKKNLADAVVICPDSIRKEINGSVSSQKNGGAVFDIAYERLEKALSEKKETVFDATSVRLAYISRLIGYASKHGTDVEVVKMKMSEDPKMCAARVKADMVNKVDRSDVPYDVINRMHGEYMSLRIPDPSWARDFPNIKITAKEM